MTQDSAPERQQRLRWSVVDARPVPYEQAWPINARDRDDNMIRVIGVVYEREWADEIVRAHNKAVFHD